MKLFSWEYIKDVNYSYFYIRGIEELDELKFWGKKSFVLRIIIYFYYLAKRVMVDIYTIKRLTIKIDNKVIFYPISNNNIEPMVGINNAMKMESIFLSPDRKLKHTFILPMSYSYLLGLIFIPILVINYFNFSRDEKYRIKLFYQVL